MTRNAITLTAHQYIVNPGNPSTDTPDTIDDPMHNVETSEKATRSDDGLHQSK